ncbi:MAG: glycosyltransferase [Myxococcaceae bacterium]
MARRIVILAPGSRGDVQPYAALAQGFARAGHRPLVVTTVDHEALVQGYGLEGRYMPFNVQAALEGSVEAIEGTSHVTSFRELAALARKGSRLLAEHALAACEGADLIVAGFSGAVVGHAVGAKLGVPLAQAYNVPLTPTGLYPGALVPRLGPAPFLHRLGHRLTRQGLWMTMRMGFEPETLALLGVRSLPLLPPSVPGLVPGPVLYGLSEHFLPRDPAWGDEVSLSGFWFAQEPDGWKPAPELEAFLAAGAPPVCVGFGSMASRDPKALTALVLEAAQRWGRTVLLSGWAGLASASLPKDVFVLRQAPHSWLYPRCRVVVHHGGAGTTAAALRAGVPAVVVPFHGDQFFWGERVFAAGTGARPVARSKLTAARLVEAVETAGEPARCARAAELGQLISKEDGVSRAVEQILAPLPLG